VRTNGRKSGAEPAASAGRSASGLPAGSSRFAPPGRPHRLVPPPAQPPPRSRSTRRSDIPIGTCSPLDPDTRTRPGGGFPRPPPVPLPPAPASTASPEL